MFLNTAVHCQFTCPAFGTQTNSLPGQQTFTGVIGWEFCYYTSQLLEETVRFFVYRRDRVQRDSYSLVQGSAFRASVSVSNTDSTGQCNRVNLIASNYFQIRENDVVGACITQSSTPLYLTSNGVGEIYQNEGFESQCSTFDQAGISHSISTRDEDFSRRSDILHLHAITSKNYYYLKIV